MGNVISVVRICNSHNGNYPLELGHAFTLHAYRNKRLYRLLQTRRLKHIMDTKVEMYVLYTAHDYLKEFHIISDDTKKIIKILNDYSNFIRGYRITKKIEEEILDSIHIYNNYIKNIKKDVIKENQPSQEEQEENPEEPEEQDGGTKNIESKGDNDNVGDGDGDGDGDDIINITNDQLTITHGGQPLQRRTHTTKRA
jgi:hypothetical protein